MQSGLKMHYRLRSKEEIPGDWPVQYLHSKGSTHPAGSVVPRRAITDEMSGLSPRRVLRFHRG
jgi:hypothetical protein